MPVDLARVIDRDDVRMRQRGGDPRLVREALPETGGFREIGRDHLQRGLAAQRQVVRLVDHAHPAAPDPRVEPVAGDDRADPSVVSRVRHDAAQYGGRRPRGAEAARRRGRAWCRAERARAAGRARRRRARRRHRSRWPAPRSPIRPPRSSRSAPREAALQSRLDPFGLQVGPPVIGLDTLESSIAPRLRTLIEPARLPDPARGARARARGARGHAPARARRGRRRHARPPAAGRGLPRRQHLRAHAARRRPLGAAGAGARAPRPRGAADPPRGAAARHRQDRDPGLDPAQARQALARRSSR